MQIYYVIFSFNSVNNLLQIAREDYIKTNLSNRILYAGTAIECGEFIFPYTKEKQYPAPLDLCRVLPEEIEELYADKEDIYQRS